MNDQKTRFSVYLIIIFLPFFLFYWMIPFVSRVTIGSDYLEILRMQMELLFSIKTGSFPLYVPGFASGHSSSALTLGQIFHPVSYIASIFPGYWEGKLIDVNNLLKLLSLGFTHMVLFIFLRKIKLSNLYSFIISFITVYNLRILDLYRYGPALESYIDYIILCVAIGWYYLSPTKWLGPLCIIGATYILVCSGHPQMMYYGLIGAGLFALITPFFIADMLQDRIANYETVIKFWVKTGFFIVLGIILSSAYILPFYFDFISMNVDRVSQNYAWTNENLDSFIGTVNNFVLPLRSEAHGAFGGSYLILMAAMLPLLIVFKVKIPRSIWAAWGIVLLLFLFMQGPRTPVHRLAWEYLPLASSFRTAGRISMIMPIFIMMILAWAVSAKPFSYRTGRFSFLLTPSGILACFSVLIIAGYYFFYVAGYHIFSFSIVKDLFPTHFAGNFYNIPFFWVELITIICGITSLVTLAMYGARVCGVKTLGVLLIVAILMQTGISLKYRSAFWIGNTYVSPTFEEIKEQKRKKLDYLYYPGGGMHSSIVNAQLERSFVEPFLGKIFTYVTSVSSLDDAYNRMILKRLPHQIFVEGYRQDKAQEFSQIKADRNKGTVQLIYSSFNRLQFSVNSLSTAFFGLSYPYTGHWRALVNGERVRVYRANGASHAVEIPEGESLVEFRYWSNASFWGMVISCTTLAVIGLFICFRALNGLSRITGIICALFIGAGGFMLWYNSLYTGDNLETEYTWAYTTPSETPNLAYGKKNWLGPSATTAHWFFPHARWHYSQQALYVSRFVDGANRPGSGFSTRLSDNPDWVLDLSRIEEIKKIVLYESIQIAAVNSIGSPVPDKIPLANVRPLQIALSKDGIKWITVQSVITPIDHHGPTSIFFDKSQTARFIKIRASGKSRLSLDEVEVYGPEDNG